MEQLLEQITSYKKEIDSFELGETNTAEAFRIKYLGSRGLVKELMAGMKNVPSENKKVVGQVLNDFKIFTEKKYEELKEASGNHRVSTVAESDLTLPGDPL